MAKRAFRFARQTASVRSAFPPRVLPSCLATGLPALRLALEHFSQPRGACLQTGLMPLSASGDLSAFAVRPYLCVRPFRLATGLRTLLATARGLPANRPAAVQRFGRSFRVRHSAVPVRLAFPPCDWPRNAFRGQAGLACKLACRRSALRAVFPRSPFGRTCAFGLPALRLASERFSRPRGACLQTGLMPLSASGDLSAFAVRPYLGLPALRLASERFRDRAGLACKPA